MTGVYSETWTVDWIGFSLDGFQQLLDLVIQTVSKTIAFGIQFVVHLETQPKLR